MDVLKVHQLLYEILVAYGNIGVENHAIQVRHRLEFWGHLHLVQCGKVQPMGLDDNMVAPQLLIQ